MNFWRNETFYHLGLDKNPLPFEECSCNMLSRVITTFFEMSDIANILRKTYP